MLHISDLKIKTSDDFQYYQNAAICMVMYIVRPTFWWDAAHIAQTVSHLFIVTLKLCSRKVKFLKYLVSSSVSFEIYRFLRSV